MVYDLKEITKDVSNVGYWRIGDVEVNLNSLEELSYIIGLIR